MIAQCIRHRITVMDHIQQREQKGNLRQISAPYMTGHTECSTSTYWSVANVVKRLMMFIRSNHAPICYIKCGTLPADFVLVYNFVMYALPLRYWQKCPKSDQRLLFSSSVRAMKTGAVTLIIFKRFSALLWEPCTAPQQVPHPAPEETNGGWLLRWQVLVEPLHLSGSFT